MRTYWMLQDTKTKKFVNSVLYTTIRKAALQLKKEVGCAKACNEIWKSGTDDYSKGLVKFYQKELNYYTTRVIITKVQLSVVK
jgi:hypothetical protein